MDISAFGKKASQWLNKYKYIMLVLMIGLGLMLLPGKSEKESVSQSQTIPAQEQSLHHQLAEILSTVDGAGKVEVLLTQKAGEETIYQTNSNLTENGDNHTSQITTVMISTSDKSETGLVRQILPPVYLGAVVVCKGADSPSVRLAIVSAVSNATGLGADQITVLKMK